MPRRTSNINTVAAGPVETNKQQVEGHTYGDCDSAAVGADRITKVATTACVVTTRVFRYRLAEAPERDGGGQHQGQRCSAAAALATRRWWRSSRFQNAGRSSPRRAPPQPMGATASRSSRQPEARGGGHHVGDSGSRCGAIGAKQPFQRQGDRKHPGLAEGLVNRQGLLASMSMIRCSRSSGSILCFLSVL